VHSRAKAAFAGLVDAGMSVALQPPMASGKPISGRSLFIVSTTVGALLGYALLSPFGMVFFHASHANIDPHEMQSMQRSVIGAAGGAFGVHMALWWGAFTVLGTVLGSAVGVVLCALRRRGEQIERYAARVDEANVRIAEAYHQLVRMDRMASMGLLSATVIHDLNNFLTIILSTSEMEENDVAVSGGDAGSWRIVRDAAARIGQPVDKGEADGTRGFASLSPRYSVLRSTMFIPPWRRALRQVPPRSDPSRPRADRPVVCSGDTVHGLPAGNGPEMPRPHPGDCARAC